MATLKYLSQYFSTTLNVGGGIDASQTTGIILQSVSGVHDITEPGQICVTYSDPIDTSVAEWIDYTSINGSNELVGAVRGREGFSAHIHLQNATVAFVLSASHHNDMVDAVKKVYNETTDTLLKATAAEVATGTDDTKIVTPLAAAPYGNNSMARQAIINGNFDVWQRGVSFTPLVDNTLAFLADHWKDLAVDDGGTLPTLTRTRELLTGGDIPNAFYYTRLTTNGAGTSLGVNSLHFYRQSIENGVRNLCGLGKQVTLSFWARSDIANKRICPVLVQNYGSGGSPSAQEPIKGTPITLTSTWTKYTATFTTNTLVGKTFGTVGDDSIRMDFYYAWGTTWGNTYVQASVTAETYVGAGYVDIAQVQLCAGDVALPFQPKSFEEELRGCLRYFWKSFTYAVAPAQNSGSRLGSLGYRAQISSTTAGGSLAVYFPVKMRTNPTITYFNPSAANAKWRNQSAGADSADASSSGSIGDNGFLILNAQVAGDTAGHVIDVHATAEAEL